MKHSEERLIAILNALIITPHISIKQMAAELKISPVTFYTWQAKSAKDEANNLGDKSEFWCTWMDQTSYWHRHCILARKLSILRIDSKFREAALNNHKEPLFSQGGSPVWQIDALVAAQIVGLDEETVAILYYDAPYVHDESGARIQVMIEKPPNPQILIKAVTSLLPEIYGEKVEHNVQVGGVLRLAAPQAAPMKAIDTDFTTLVEAPESVLPATNVLAVSETMGDEQLESAFGGKRLVEAELFYDAKGVLQPPLPHVIIVEGSEIDKAYSDAGIEHQVTSPETLISQGYRNRFLLKLRPEAVAATVVAAGEGLSDIDRAIAKAQALGDQQLHEALLDKKGKAEHRPALPTDRYVTIAERRAMGLMPPESSTFRRADDLAEGIGYGGPAPGGKRM